jgi:hypothetical protein
MLSRNLVILTLCQLISATGSIVMVTLGGIVGTTLAANPALATLPVSMSVVAMALMTVPASLLMNRIGRRAGFALGNASPNSTPGCVGMRFSGIIFSILYAFQAGARTLTSVSSLSPNVIFAFSIS